MSERIEKEIIKILSKKKVKPSDLINMVVLQVNPGIKPIDMESLIFDIRECIWSLITGHRIELLPNRELALIKKAR